MKHSRYISTGIIICICLFFVSTSSAWFHRPQPSLPDIPKEWTAIDPEIVYPDFEYNRLTPSCAACPDTVDLNTGEMKSYNPKFTFFVKGGYTNKLVVYFQGGGACWDTINCVYFHTYMEEVPNIADYDTRFMGIFDTELFLNPFKDWYFVYIPYCTGDVHWGAKDTVYPDTLGLYGGVGQEIRHRGFVNFQVVLKWIRDNFEKPDKIFVSGSSAGAYGAIMGFPYIKESFPRSKVYVLGDAGNGVTTETFQEDSINNWNIQIPEWVPGFEGGYTPDMTIDYLYKHIARYYRFSKLAQFTTAWDWNQTFYYYLMNHIDDDPISWDTGWPLVWEDWHDQMLDYVYSAAEMPNYRYYIAAGDYHTILMSPDFYLERSAGIPFLLWVNSMVQNPFGLFGGPLEGFWKNVECDDCEDPIP